MKKIVFTSIITLFCFATFAQNNKALSLYNFVEETETYTSISSSGTALTPNSWDDGVTSLTPIGFNFVYNQVTYTEFSVNTNGTVNLDSQNSQATNDLESETFTNLLAPLWDDLKFHNNGSGEGIFYNLEGTEGSKILTIEFYNVGRYDNIGVSVGVVNFQVKLFEQDNSIKFIYGDLSPASDWSEHSTTSIGLNAEGTSQTEFVSVTPDNINGATVSSDTENAEITPETLALIASGTTYIFTPPEETTDYDISISVINSPVSGFLSIADSVKITIENLGNEITEGLTLSYEIIETETGTQIGATVIENYQNYPIQSLSVYSYTFSNTVNLSENGNYSINISLNINENDVNLENNEMSVEISGIVLDEVIYNNGPIITQTGIGAYGKDVSEVQTALGMSNYSYNTFWEIGYRNADEFIVPEGEMFVVSGIGFYNYQTETDTVPTINYLDFRIFDGSPELEETNVLYNFYDQNILSGSKWTGIYRVYDTDLQNTDRPVMLSVANFEEGNEIILSDGTYWLDWSSGGEIISGPWTPFITTLGETTTGNALHLGYEGWVNWEENGTLTQQGMPFILYGHIGLTNINETDNEIVVYPNPTPGLFNIKTSSTCDISISDITGKIIYQNNNYFNENIDLSSSQFGIYIIKIIENNKQFTKKLIIK